MSNKNHQGTTPERLLSILTDAQTPQRIRLSLSEMIIAWFKDNQSNEDVENEQTYLSFIVLNNMLKAMEGGGE